MHWDGGVTELQNLADRGHFTVRTYRQSRTATAFWVIKKYKCQHVWKCDPWKAFGHSQISDEYSHSISLDSPFIDVILAEIVGLLISD